MKKKEKKEYVGQVRVIGKISQESIYNLNKYLYELMEKQEAAAK